ncbi:MAG: hypothetical protein LBJ10_01190, partial [Clostridiales bacterium]|nr:hypothetical protein [Clostridiales bacterium]
MAGARLPKNARRAAQARAGKARAFADRGMSAVAAVSLSLIPLAYRMVKLDYVSPEITNTTTVDTAPIYDTFTHVKMVILYAAAIAMLGLFLAKLLAGGHALRLSPFDAALALMCAFLMLSYFMSEYKSVALNGFIYMMDGTLEHICYCLLFFIGFHSLSGAGSPRIYFVPLYAAGAANALISLLNFLGVSMIDTAAIKFFLGIPIGARAVDAADFTSTFGNINYLSGFGGVAFSIFLAKLLLGAEPAGAAIRGVRPGAAWGAKAGSAKAGSAKAGSAGAVAGGANGGGKRAAAKAAPAAAGSAKAGSTGAKAGSAGAKIGLADAKIGSAGAKAGFAGA